MTVFSEQNFEIFKEKDLLEMHRLTMSVANISFMAGPAFAMIYNAITGSPDAVKRMERQCACTRISGLQNQKEEYIELYGYATGIYENAYSCDDLMEGDPGSSMRMRTRRNLREASEALM